MTQGEFRVDRSESLGAPLQQAFAQALMRGGTFTIKLAPGSYEGGVVSLKDPSGQLDLTLEGEGPAPAVLQATRLDLAARSVVLRNLVISGAMSPASVVSLQAGVTLLLDRVALVNNRCHDASAAEALLELRASQGGSPQVTMKDSWLVGNQMSGEAPLVATPGSGRARLQGLRFENTVFAGNVAAAGLVPWFTPRTVLVGCLVYEPSLKVWTALRSPLAEVVVDGGAVLLGGDLAHYQTGPDAARADFKDVHLKGVVQGLAKVPPDWAAFTGPALRATRPDLKALLSTTQRP